MAVRAATLVWLLVSAASAAACPFCGVVARPLAERRDEAAVVAIGEAAGRAQADDTGLLAQPFSLRQPLRGRAPDAGVTVNARVTAPVEGTAILLRVDRPEVRAAADLDRWEAIAADETLLGHVVAAPATDRPAAERLRWFADRLDHPDRRIADDAFAEFGLAPYEAVREAAGAIDRAWLRDCVADTSGEQKRRGFCGLVLGIRAAGAADRAAAEQEIALLTRAIETPGSDVRAGFDGLLGGLLVAEGAEALGFFDRRGLFAPDARAGDARHLLAALRFAWESLGDRLPRERTAAATARLLDNPAVAADAAVDLARYAAWGEVDRVAALWDRLGRDDPLIRRAVVGYLQACPQREARAHLERLRAADPRAVAEAAAAAGLR
jgi:hypothetical protein